MGEASLVIVKWEGFARICHLCETNCCNELTCCFIRGTRQSLELSNRMDSCSEQGSRTAAIGEL